MSDDWLPIWDSLEEAQRSQILATLIDKAAKRAEADRDVYASNFTNKPKVEIYDCSRDGENLTVEYLFHWWEWCPAQSGSDWNYHCVYRGVGRFKDSALLGNEIVPIHKNYVHEYAEKNYDADAVLREVRTQLRDRI